MQASATLEILPKNEFITGFDLPLNATLFPLGFPLVIETNSGAVLEAARESWGAFGPEFGAAEPIRLSLAVTGAAERPIAGPPAFRSRGHLMTIVCDGDHQMVCDFRGRCASGWVTPEVAANRPVLRRHFLEASVLSLLVQAHLAPVHGALVKRNGRGILLCGASFAGKSTLALACARDGWYFVSDDGTFLVRDRPGIYGIGNPYTMSLREGARQFFPELADRPLSVRPGGKVGIDIMTRELPIEIAPGSPIDHLVFLERITRGDARLAPCDPAEVLAWCDACASYGEDHVRQAQRRSYRRLLAAGLWRMQYSDLDGALALLHQLQASVI